MRKIEHFGKKGGRLVSIADSVSGIGSKSTWVGDTKRFWVKATYPRIDGEAYPGTASPEEIYLLDDGEPDPAPQSGWCYAKGFFG